MIFTLIAVRYLFLTTNLDDGDGLECQEVCKLLPRQWSSEEVHSWLKKQGFDREAELFQGESHDLYHFHMKLNRCFDFRLFLTGEEHFFCKPGCISYLTLATVYCEKKSLLC